MRLKRIELSGFKSFVDPVKIDLADGVTAIVGPNGSGKSNIVDAIRWVLGEHSARHLRGNVMDDLIFQGSETRPPVGVCDVELTFAVEPGRLSPPYHELDEIRVRRRLTREGGSDAFINGKAARLKDVVDLFLDTGVSTRAYAIIEQGAIARMISSKPEERRAILEEAAGVMKYRARRREAELKMNHTRQNLERVADLLEEVRTQCRSLKQQASRAERFKKMQQEWEGAQALALGIRYRRHAARCREMESALSDSRAAEEQQAAALAAAERALHEARERLVAHEEEAQRAQDALRQAEQERAELQRQAERQAGERRLLAEREQAMHQRIREAGERIAQLERELAEQQRKLEAEDDAALAQALAEAQEAEEAARREHDQARTARDAALAEFERIRNQREQAERQKQAAAQALERLTARAAALEAQRGELDARIRDADDALARLTSEAGKLRARREQAESELEAAQQRLDDLRARLAEAESALDEQLGETRSLRGEIQELEARARNRDIPETLVERLREAGATWVDEALQAPEGLERAVVAALRAEGGNARVPPSALPALLAILGETGDAPVAVHAGEAAAVAGSLADALELGDDHPLRPVFGDVLLVEHIADAPDALKARPDASAAVSRDGWRMEASGWLTPPAHEAGARRLAARRELARKRGLLARAEAELTRRRDAVQAIEAELTAQQQAWQAAHLALTEAQSAASNAEATLQRTTEELEALTARRHRLASELEDIAAERAHWDERQAGEDAPDPEQLAGAERRLNECNAAEARARQALDQRKNSRAAAEQALALHRQAMEAVRRECRRLEEEAARLAQRREQDKAALADVLREEEAAAAHEELDARLARAAETVERLHREMNEVRKQGHELQQAAHQAERAEREARAARQAAAETRQQREIALAAETARLQDMEAEIRQRCNEDAASLLARLEEAGEELDEEAALRRAAELEERLGRFGPVNLLAIEEYEQAAEREQFLSEQCADLESSLATLEDTIARIDRTTRQRFMEAFEQVNARFRETFPRLFGGGRAELRLDSDDVQTAGVEVIAQPPGKRLQDIDLLSGGEKALTAVALVFSIFRLKPAPFCVLDEVDAPLDDANVGRFGEMVREFADQVQFLAITHNKVTMQMANRIIGVSMPEPGVSRIVGVDLDTMEEELQAAG